jgi:hypothetical protein
MSFWHSATFNNDGTKLLFSDEWGGGGQPRCRATDKPEWGADALFTIENSKLKFHSYYKLPAPQTPLENCVAHNGSLIPIPGRDVMVQAWYQGGLSVFDWTDIDHPKEIAYFDRGPIDEKRHGDGRLVVRLLVQRRHRQLRDRTRASTSTSCCRTASSARTSSPPQRPVKTPYLNTQDQQKIVWAPSFAVARAYLDQLERSEGSRRGDDATAPDHARHRRALGSQRKAALTQLASQLNTAAASARDQAKVRTLSTAVTDLANAPR